MKINKDQLEIIITKTFNYINKKKSQLDIKVDSVDLDYFLNDPVRKIDGCWGTICRDVYGKYSFNESSQLQKMWIRNDHNFKTIILDRLNFQKPKINSIDLVFSIKEWDILIDKYGSKSNTKGFLVEFDNIISEMLQNHGINCWLRSCHNYFGQKILWSGKFRCIASNPSCPSIFFANALKLDDNIIVRFDCDLTDIVHQKTLKPLWIKGLKRKEQALLCASSGIDNCLNENIISNQTTDKQSNYIR